MARVLRCDVCRRVEDPFEGPKVHEHMVKRKNKLLTNTWDELHICETCLVEFRKIINEKKQEV